MSKLGEYLALIPRGMKNVPQILEAVTNQVKMELGTLPKEKQEVIIGRRMICATCPYMSKNAVKGYEIEGKSDIYETDRDDEHCIWCGCPIASRTASLEMVCRLVPGIAARQRPHLNQPKCAWLVKLHPPLS